MTEKLKKIWQHKVKTLLAIVAGAAFVLVQVPLVEAWEAHVINVTAKIVQPCDSYSISGFKFFDHNQNGIRDEGDQGLSGWIIELKKIFDERYDYNNDGIYTQEDIDILTEVADVSDDLCPSGKKCHWNNDGWVDEQDVALFVAFLSSLPISQNSLTDQNGNYIFDNIEEGTYVINEVIQDGWTATTLTEVTLEQLSCGDNEVNFGNFSEVRECPALSIGYWQNHAGCPTSSDLTMQINDFSFDFLSGYFKDISGELICEKLAPSQCPKGNSLESKLCKAEGKVLADISNLVAGNLDPNAVIAGADDGSSAFDNLNLTSNSTILQALQIMEATLAGNPSAGDLADINHVAERIYSFYEDENLQFPACLYTWVEPEFESQILGVEVEPILGCTDETAQNYNSNATEDNGNCKYKIEGCTDELALNYNPDATKDDKSCLPAEASAQEGEYEIILASIPGCTDEVAINYNIEATVDDATCQYEPVIISIPGCTDEAALNYNIEATVDDGTCLPAEASAEEGEYEQIPADIPGCTDVIALNYNPEATAEDNSCIYPILGCTDESANNYNVEATTDDQSCTYDILGCTDESADNFNIEATLEDSSCTYTVLGCTNETAINYNVDATEDDNSCLPAEADLPPEA